MKSTCIILLLLIFHLSSIAQVTKSNNTSGTYLNSSDTRTITFDISDFGGNTTIDNVIVVLEFSSEDDGTIGFTFHEDLAFRLESPSGTTVDLVYDVRGIFTGNPLQSPTYGGFNPTGNVQVTFDDNALQSIASSPGGDPTTGTFVPIEPLSSFLGESPIGDWTLHLADSFDNGFNDQLLFNFVSISITTPTLSVVSEDEKTINIYPTVTNRTLLVDFPEDIFYSAQITNTLGKIVWSSSKMCHNNINVAWLETGVYILSIHANGRSYHKKFIKT